MRANLAEGIDVFSARQYQDEMHAHICSYKANIENQSKHSAMLDIQFRCTITFIFILLARYYPLIFSNLVGHDLNY